jgi:hypothetical protein
MEGYGEFIWPDGKKYLGYYENNERNGFGIFLSSLNPLNVYVGNWVTGKQHGIGLIIQKKNIRYGLWSKGKNTSIFQGYWEMKIHSKKNNIPFNKLYKRNADEIIELLK